MLKSNFLLNREEISELTLELLALDSGTPRLTGTGTLRVIVEDVNDNEPTFENDVYFLTTEENVEVGTALDTILAVDGDFGLNAKIRSVIFCLFYQHAKYKKRQFPE
jgi:protocadherin Fat 4